MQKGHSFRPSKPKTGYAVRYKKTYISLRSGRIRRKTHTTIIWLIMYGIYILDLKKLVGKYVTCFLEQQGKPSMMDLIAFGQSGSGSQRALVVVAGYIRTIV